MFDKLEDLLIRFEEILGELQQPDVVNDQERFRKLMKEQNDLTPIVEAYKEYKNCKQAVEDSLLMLEEETDEEMREMAKEELNDSKRRIEELEQELKILLLPKDPNDEKNVLVEIRAGAGGDEAALFAAEIYRMYVHYAESRRWRTENHFLERERNRRLQGGCLYDYRTGRLFPFEIRERCASCTASAGDRERRAYPHFYYHRGNHAGSGRGGCSHRR